MDALKSHFPGDRQMALQVDGRLMPILSIKQSRIEVEGKVEEPRAVSRGDLVFEKGPQKVSIFLAGRLEPAGEGSSVFIYEGREAEHERMLGAVAWMNGPDLVPVDFIRAQTYTARPAGTFRWKHATRDLTVACLCLIVGAYVLKEVAFSLEIPADSAFVTAEAETILSPASGSVAYLAPADQLKMGEPLAGVETNHGRAITADATHDGTVIARHVRLGDVVARGAPVMTVTKGDPMPFIMAYIDGKSLLRMGRDATAQIYLPDGRNVTVPIGAENISGATTAADGSSLISLRLPVAGVEASAIGRLVNVRFKLSSPLDSLILRL